MNILSIETSCDETAVSLVSALGDFPEAKYEVLGNALFSQIDIHREYGGVFPMLAKREHIATLVPMLKKAIDDSKLPSGYHPEMYQDEIEKVNTILTREPGLADQLLGYYAEKKLPSISLIAVTAGPGLEPALWVGVNFAKALSVILRVPVVAVNHMEGHILASLIANNHITDVADTSEVRGEASNFKLHPVVFPALSLLISGGHTELIKFTDWNKYERIGETRDDAVGEAFDKVARLLGLPYPGGPEISKLAQKARDLGLKTTTPLPRPMLDSKDFDFSFSGLKTAVLYRVKDKNLTEEEKMEMAREFEDAAIEVLLEKSVRAVKQNGINTFILGGGVTANKHLRQVFTDHFASHFPDTTLYLPEPKLSTDNSIMIALSGHSRVKEGVIEAGLDAIMADGNRSLTEEV
jgi:N6-L-threonylcarbamoyladenine synthase